MLSPLMTRETVIGDTLGLARDFVDGDGAASAAAGLSHSRAALPSLRAIRLTRSIDPPRRYWRIALALTINNRFSRTIESPMAAIVTHARDPGIALARSSRWSLRRRTRRRRI